MTTPPAKTSSPTAAMLRLLELYAKAGNEGLHPGSPGINAMIREMPEWVTKMVIFFSVKKLITGVGMRHALTKMGYLLYAVMSSQINLLESSNKPGDEQYPLMFVGTMKAGNADRLIVGSWAIDTYPDGKRVILRTSTLAGGEFIESEIQIAEIEQIFILSGIAWGQNNAK